VINVTLDLIDHGMTLQEAIDAPRLSVASTASTVSVDAGFPAETIAGLRALGHTVALTDIGSVQAVLIDQKTGKQYGAADVRREGTVIGLPRPRGQ
jgi:gamma-glutamyltranspeptidase / glutathione hydrolase